MMATPLFLRALPWFVALLLVAPGAMAQIYGTAAIVNGVEISNFRLERYFDDYVKDKGRSITKMINPRVYKKLKKEALDQLIDKELVWQAAQRANVQVTDAEVAAAVKELEAQYKTRDAYLRKIENAGFDEKGYAEYIRRELVIQRYLKTGFAPKPVTDAEVHEYYASNPEKFMRPERVRARHVLVKLERTSTAQERDAARKRIEEARIQVVMGRDFAEIARLYSDDKNSVEQGGDVGFFKRGQMVPEFEAAAFRLQVGEISEVVQTDYGLHIIKVEAREASSAVSEDEAREQLRQAMNAHRRDNAVRDGIKALRDQAKIQVLVRLEDDPEGPRRPPAPQ